MLQLTNDEEKALQENQILGLKSHAILCPKCKTKVHSLRYQLEGKMHTTPNWWYCANCDLMVRPKFEIVGMEVSK